MINFHGKHAWHHGATRSIFLVGWLRGDRCQRVLLLNDGSHVLLTTQHSTKVVQDHHDGHGFRFDSDVNAFGFAVVVANRNDDWHVAAGWVAGPRQFGRWLFASISMLLKQRTVRLAASKPALPAHTHGHCVSTRPPTTRLKSQQPSSEHTAQRPRCARTELAFVNVGSIGIQGT